MTTTADLLLRNVTLPTGRSADVAVSGGTIRHVGAPVRADETIDCRGLICLPGAIDMHVHMRGGVQAEKEDWHSGSRSAIAGGVTVVVDQPNTMPPITTPGLLAGRIAEARRDAVCGFAVNGGVVPGADLSGMWERGAMAFGETFAAPSSYGEGLDAETLKTLFARIRSLGALATIHAEEVDPSPPATLSEHDCARSAAGEARAVRAVSAQVPPGMRVHFCHLSSAASIDAACGTVEVTPHHLFLSYEDFEPEDARAKVNPPIRDERTRREVWSRWDSIDVVASDHAPHTLREKKALFSSAPSGIPGVETMVPLLMAAVQKRRITLSSVMEKTSFRPAAILGIPRAGFNPGDRADFAFYPDTITRIDPDRLHSRSGWSPFVGLDAIFPKLVIVAGRRVYRDGEYLAAHAEWYPGGGYLSSHDQY